MKKMNDTFTQINLFSEFQYIHIFNPQKYFL